MTAERAKNIAKNIAKNRQWRRRCNHLIGRNSGYRELRGAVWLVFLSVHFGKNGRTGWRLACDVYGAFGNAPACGWARVSANPQAFRRWLSAHCATSEMYGTGAMDDERTHRPPRSPCHWLAPALARGPTTDYDIRRICRIG
ncbi:MAG: hypothetical protein ACREHV_15985 [Rhizomicrobium sp.]